MSRIGLHTCDPFGLRGGHRSPWLFRMHSRVRAGGPAYHLGAPPKLLLLGWDSSVTLMRNGMPIRSRFCPVHSDSISTTPSSPVKVTKCRSPALLVAKIPTQANAAWVGHPKMVGWATRPPAVVGLTLKGIQADNRHYPFGYPPNEETNQQSI